jgi:hypothetical protein
MKILEKAYSSVIITSTQNTVPMSSAAVLCGFPDEGLICDRGKLVRSSGKHLYEEMRMEGFVSWCVHTKLWRSSSVFCAPSHGVNKLIQWD